MLNINKTIENDVVTIELEGRLNNLTAPGLQTIIEESIEDAGAFIFDFKELEYLSSAGLRILLTTQQMMEETGRPDVTVQGANAEILEVFEVTGFYGVLNIK